MCYEEQVLDYWSKIVLDQREFREKLLKAGNGTLFPRCRHSYCSEQALREKSGLQEDCMRARPGLCNRSESFSEKLLRRVSDLPESLRSVWSVLLISSANEEEVRHKQQPTRDEETVPQERLVKVNPWFWSDTE